MICRFRIWNICRDREMIRGIWDQKFRSCAVTTNLDLRTKTWVTWQGRRKEFPAYPFTAAARCCQSLTWQPSWRSGELVMERVENFRTRDPRIISASRLMFWIWIPRIIGVLEVPFLFSTGLSWYDSATMLLSKTHLCKCFLYCPISSLISLIIGYIMSQ